MIPGSLVRRASRLYRHMLAFRALIMYRYLPNTFAALNINGLIN
jgi:hypothetical protein